MSDILSPLLLTPGPLTTAPKTRAAMQRDYGSRDAAFIALTRRVRNRLSALSRGEDTHVSVPLQGSGTYAVEATLGTLLDRTRKTLVLVNGAYGKRIERICRLIGVPITTYETAEDVPPDSAEVSRLLRGDSTIADVVLVHCETTSGILNPLESIAAAAAAERRGLIVDAMSSFGAIPIDLRRIPIDALIGSSNKCLEGVPGIGLALIRRARLEASAGKCHSLSLDLHDQWKGFEANGQWRFTPPTHVLAALDAALDGLDEEGGVAGRFARYRENCQILSRGLTALGAHVLLPENLQAPIIVTFRMPTDPAFHFKEFYTALSERGYVIYPGKLTGVDSFRVGCIGQVHAADMEGLVDTMRHVLQAMGVKSLAP
ncbi:MAG: 2-aminoethylphosphonate--pyruvate transaminase [Alphaproteobacteria bacterium]|nr:2-aminoethylphosphonate--pyruvate transaminase [Alphaproteobacteria bacterium]